MDKLKEALELENKAKALRMDALRENQKKEIESRASFEKRTGIRVYVASDYAGCETGGLSFYYGYEERQCAKHGKECGDDCESYEWAFVARRGNSELLRLGTTDISPEKNEDPLYYLVAGMAHYLKN